jgi:hypothetical protein
MSDEDMSEEWPSEEEGDDEDADIGLMMQMLENNPALAQQLGLLMPGLVQQPAAVPAVAAPRAEAPFASKLIDVAELRGECAVASSEPRAFLVGVMRQLCGGTPAQFLKSVGAAGKKKTCDVQVCSVNHMTLLAP